ncbi:type 1 fimbrial protein [Proteus mirabilis]|nr:type 1 fimbrial protein [Proteus mirabilis]
MKKVLLSLAMLSVISTPVLAKTPVANLKINGDIKPPTCTINGGNVDLVYNLGNISPSVIPNDMTYNQLPSISNTLTVTCDTSTFLTFRATDGDNGYDNGNWSYENEIVKGATVGWTAEQQKYVPLDKLNLLSGKTFKATFYNENKITYNVAQTYLHPKKMLTEDGIDLTMGLDYTGQVILTFNFGV